MANQIILTALEGALLSSPELGSPEPPLSEAALREACERVRPAIAQLTAMNVPVIVFTQRDRTELEPIRQQLGLESPFIAESGSAVFTPIDHNPFSTGLGEAEEGYYVLTLGCPYVQARAGLRVLANVISHPLKGFGDFTVPQLQRSAGLSESAAHRAKAREFSEPFMTPKAVEPKVLRQAAEDMGFSVILRSAEESRFSELLGAQASVTEAVRMLLAAYQQRENEGISEDPLKIMALSHRSADLAGFAEVQDALGISDWQNKVVTSSDNWVDAITPILNSAT